MSSLNKPSNENSLQNILVCPYCKKSVPDLLFTQTNEQMSLTAHCSCSPEDKVTSLNEYMEQMTQLDKDQQILFDVMLNAQCLQHWKPFSIYCSKCRQNLCADCLNEEKHMGHTLLGIDEENVQKIDINDIDYVMYKNEEQYNFIIQKLTKGIEDLSKDLNKINKMKQEIEELYKVNHQTNVNLKQLYQRLTATAQLMSDTPMYQVKKMQKSIRINKQIDDSDETWYHQRYPKLTRHLKMNYIFNQDQGLYKCNTILSNDERVLYIKILSNGLLASTNSNSIFRLYDLTTNECKCKYQLQGLIEALIELKDGRLAFGTQKGTIFLFNITSKEIAAPLEGHNNQVICLFQLFDGRLASGSYDKSIKLWDITTGQCQVTLNGHSNRVEHLLQVTNGRLVSTSYDKTTKFWDVTTNECLVTFTSEREIKRIFELPEGRLALSYWPYYIRLFDLTNDRVTLKLDDANWNMILLKDGRLAFPKNNFINFWDFSKDSKSQFDGLRKEFAKIFELTNGRLALLSNDNFISIWNLKTCEFISSLDGNDKKINHIIQLPDGRLAARCEDNTIKMWTI